MDRVRSFTRAHLIAIGYLILATGFVYVTYLHLSLARDTNQIVKTELAERDAQISAANFIITQQAVPALTAMQRQIRELGGEPPLVLLSPTEPSFAEQQK